MFLYHELKLIYDISESKQCDFHVGNNHGRYIVSPCIKNTKRFHPRAYARGLQRRFW